MNYKSTTISTGMNTFTVGPNGISAGIGPVSAGFNNRGQFVLGLSTPTINNTSYSVDFSLSPRQAANTATAIITIIVLKKVPAPVPILVP